MSELFVYILFGDRWWAPVVRLGEFASSCGLAYAIFIASEGLRIDAKEMAGTDAIGCILTEIVTLVANLYWLFFICLGGAHTIILKLYIVWIQRLASMKLVSSSVLTASYIAT